MAHSVTILHKIKDTLGDRNTIFFVCIAKQKETPIPKTEYPASLGLGSWAA